MADTINIEGMNEQMARTDSLVAKLAQDVDKLSTSFSNLSKSANVEKMLGAINGAFEMMSNMSGTAANNVASRVSTIIGEITKLSEIASKTGIKGGLKLDFFTGDNLTKKQKEFNAAILMMAENYEKAQANLNKYKNELLSLYAKTPEAKRNDETKNQKFLEKRYDLAQKIAKEQAVINANAEAYRLVMQKTAETQNLINQGKQSEKKDVQELTNLYRQLKDVSQKREARLSGVGMKGWSGTTMEEVNLLRNYTFQIDELEKKIAVLAQRYPELAEKMRASFNISMLEQSIKLRETEEKQTLKEADAVARVSKEIDKQIEKENKLAGQRAQRLLYEKRTSVGGALDYSANVKNEIQAKQAIEYLTAARKKLDNTDAKYAENLKRLNAEIQRHQQFLQRASGAATTLQTRTFSLLRAANQLAMGFGVMFSVYGIANFLRQLVRVTGEFEIQQTALKSIINSADKAQTMFGELQKMAVASPYSIQQLVSYNKQLAAYRVETDKLLPVLKQLGDVASGVGVDMQRLILAYGQVKAANYLRGQELRQFSEAGINILGELARRFSDAEGKVVSTGEVFDRVSKRLVKFEDVAAVFDDLTKKGGIFYDMQAKQAETVRGQLMNLKDAFQIALYEIGQETNGSIRLFLRLLKGVAKNLTTITKLGAAALALFIAWKTALAASNLLTHSMAANFKMMQMSMPKITSLFKTIGKHPLAAAASVALTILTSIVVQIVKARNRINELRKESIETFSSMTESLKEFQDAMAKSGDYQLGVDQSGAKKYKLIKTDNLKNDLRIVKDFIENLEKQGIELKPDFNLEYSERDKDKLAEKLAGFLDDVQTMAADLIAAQEGGKKVIAKFADPLEQEINRFTKKLDKLKDLIRVSSQGIEDELVSEGKKIGIPDSEIQMAVENLKRLRTGQYESLDEAREMWSVVEKLQDSITKKTGKRLAYEKESLKISKRFTEMFSVYNRGQLNVNREFENLLAQFAKFKGVDVDHLLQSMSDPKKGEQIVNQFMQFTKSAFQESGKQYTDDIWNQTLIWLRDAQKLKPFIIEPLMKKAGSSILEDNRTDWQRVYNDLVDELNKSASKYEKTVDKIDVAEWETTKEEQINKLSQRYDELQKNIQRYNNESAEQQALEKDMLEKWREEAVAVDKARRSLGYADKKTTRGVKDLSSEFEKMVKFIRQLRSEYDKLNKTFPSEDAAKRVADSFRDEFEDFPKYFRDLFGDDIKNIPFMTPEGTSAALKNVKDSKIIEKFFAAWQKKLQIFLDKNIAEEQVEIAVDLQKKSADEINRQIEELFSNYEIQLQLTELGLTSEDAKNIFNLDSIELGELGKKLGELREYILDNFGKDELEKFKEYEKKYTEIYEKAQMERLKKYSAYLQKEMSERIKVEMDTLKQLAELDAMPSLYSKDSESLQSKTRERIRERILEERDKKIAALQWKEFQQSDLYVSLFTDIGNASYQSMRLMKNSLEDLRGSLKGLSATDLKAISDNLRQIDEQLLQDNPFDALITSVRDFKKMREDLEKDETLKKILGVDEIGNFRKSIKQGIEEINKELNGYTEKQKKGSKIVVEGLTEQLAKMEELYQAAKLRYTTASELKKVGENVGAQDYFPEDRLDMWKESYESYSKLIKESEDENEIQENKTKQATIQKTIELLEQYIAANKKLGDQSGKSTEELGKEYDKLKKRAEELGITLGKLTDAQLKARIQMRAASEALKSVSETVAKIQGVYETWMENLDYLGGATDDLTEAQARLGKAVFESLRNVLDLTSRILEAIPKITEGFSAAGIAINSSMGIIGLIAEAIQLVITLVSAIGKFKDDMIAVDIKNVQRKINTLTRSYEALSEAFASAFDRNRLLEYNRLMVNNLEQQRDFLQQELELEKDKKKSDIDAINSLSDQIEDIDKQLADVSAKYYEELGGFGSDSAYKDAATQFVDAWYNAFMETGSGLSGLEDTFNEFFVNMIKKQMMQKVADQYISGILSEFDELLNRGDIWDNDYFWNDYMNELPGRLAEADEAMQELLSRLQGLFGAGGIGGLGNLQQGIQGVTEQTADILAEYLNTIRLYVAQDNQNMTALINWLGVGTTNDSLMSNIRLTAQNTAAINTLLQSLVPGQAHTLGGAGLKVFVS